MGAEMGFVSVAILFAVYGIFLYSSERIAEHLKSSYLRMVTRATTASFVGLLVHGFFENGFFLTPFTAGEFHVMLPYILMPLPFACEQLEKREGLATQGPDT